MVFVEGPFQWVLTNVETNAIEVALIPNYVVVVSALPSEVGVVVGACPTGDSALVGSHDHAKASGAWRNGGHLLGLGIQIRVL
jgi:hypothetical protein